MCSADFAPCVPSAPNINLVLPGQPFLTHSFLLKRWCGVLLHDPALSKAYLCLMNKNIHRRPCGVGSREGPVKCRLYVCAHVCVCVYIPACMHLRAHVHARDNSINIILCLYRQTKPQNPILSLSCSHSLTLWLSLSFFFSLFSLSLSLLNPVGYQSEMNEVGYHDEGHGVWVYL